MLKTTVAGTQTLAWAPFVIDEVTLVGSRCGPFDRALAALEKGEVNVQPLISERFDLGEGHRSARTCAGEVRVESVVERLERRGRL